MVRQLTRGHVLGWTALAYDPGYAAGEGLLVDLSQVQTRFDVLGRSAGYTYQYLHHAEDYTGQASDPVNFTHTYGIQYQGRDGYLEQQVWGHSTLTEFRASTSESVYDGWGRRIAIRENTPLPQSIGTVQDRVRYFSYDGGGMILRRREGLINSSGSFEQDAAAQKKDELYAYANGQQVAKQTRAGALELRTHLAAYQEADPGSTGRRADRFDAFVGAAMGKYGSVTGRGEQLEDAVTRLTDYSTGALGMGTVQVNSGDTLQGIAQRVYGNAGLWYVLAEANALGNAELVPGTSLRVPSVRVSSNDANTFKPYNPGEIVGSTAPGLPYIETPKAAGCNPLATIIMAVIAIVVTIYTAGALTSAIVGAVPGATAAGGAMTLGGLALSGGVVGTITGTTLGVSLSTLGGMVVGAVAGAAGAAVSLAVGSAMGAATFSWRSVAAGAVTGAITGGIAARFGTIGAAVNNNHWAKAAALAVANAGANAAGQVVGGGGFSWRGVAANAVSSIVSAGISKGMSKLPDNAFVGNGNMMDDFINNAVGGVVSLHTRRAFGFDDDVNYGRIAVDAFGNALGNAAVKQIQFAAANRKLQSAREAMRNAALAKNPKQVLEAIISEFPGRDAAIENMLADIGSGSLKNPEFELADLSGKGSAYENGKILIDSSIFALGKIKGFDSQYLNASLILAITEEYGHHLDYLARNVYSSVGGDSKFDEGALYAIASLDSIFSGADSSGRVVMDVDVAGSSIHLETTSFNIAMAASASFSTSRIAADYKNFDGSREYFNAIGHYYATALTALPIYGPERAARIAFGAQFPDMVGETDATITALALGMDRAPADLAIAVELAVGTGGIVSMLRQDGLSMGEKIAAQMLIDGISEDQKKVLISVQKDLHSLVGVGENIETERRAAEKIIVNNLKLGTAEGDFIAGLGIHKLGDAYAHAGFYYGIGHLMAGHEPDEFYNNPEKRNEYLYKLSALMLQGAGIIPTRDFIIQSTQSVRAIAMKTISAGIDDYHDRFIEQAGDVLESFPMQSRFDIAEPNLFFDTSGVRNKIPYFSYGLSPAAREFYTGSQSVNGASDFFYSSLASFRSQIAYWRSH